jgi:hypothetical protein
MDCSCRTFREEPVARQQIAAAEKWQHYPPGSSTARKWPAAQAPFRLLEIAAAAR